MQTTQDLSFNTVVEQFLGTRLPQQMSGAISLSGLPSDAQEFIVRALKLMKSGRYFAAEFNPALIRWLSVTVPSILPGAWGGRIPPLTLSGRHKKIDDYVANQSRTTGDAPPVFVDIGCGFPPVTTADTARKYAGWHVYGVDPAFDAYVLYDRDGHYACFNFRYAVYLKGRHGLSLDEFAFSFDNLGHIVFMPFLTFHENDPEAQMLAELTATIKSDLSFWPDFSNRQDELLKHYGICQRRSDGYLQFLAEQIQPSEYIKQIALLWQMMGAEGYLDGAVDALGQAGYEAWKNSVGDIAIRPAPEANVLF